MDDLSNLKAGDKVIVDTGYISRITTVKRITPSGLIVVGGNVETTFNKDGRERGAGWSGDRLRMWTQEAEDEINERIERGKLYARLNNQNWNRLSIDKMRRIVAILDEPQNS